METQLTIVNGPSRWDFAISLFEGEASRQKELKFTLEDRTRTNRPVNIVRVRLTGVEREDGSGDKWLFKGYYRLGAVSSKLHGYFDLERRLGWATLEDFPERALTS